MTLNASQYTFTYLLCYLTKFVKSLLKLKKNGQTLLNGKPNRSTGLRLQLPTGVRSGGFQLEGLGCPTEPANLAHFQKCPFKLRYTQQSLTENSMLCYGPLVSKLGAQTAQSAWCPQPRH